MTINLIERDHQHRELALDASKSFIVQAPAGSGKTELLIQRFLTLLNHVNTPEEVLAITFTKKAANEMRSRVIKTLKQAQVDPEPTSAHAKLTWTIARKVLQRDIRLNWNLINNPNQLRIQTIDALCAYLTKQLPLLSHFGSQPDIADNPNVLYREAVQEVLTHIEENLEWSQSIAKLLLHLDNDLNKLHDLLIHLLAKRDQWLPYIHFDTDNNKIRNELEAQLQLVIKEHLTNLRVLFPQNITPDLISILRFAADNLADKNSTSEILTCKNFADLPLVNATDKSAWIGIANLLLTKSYTWRKRPDDEMGFPTLASLKTPQEKFVHNEYRAKLKTLITALSEREDLRIALEELFILPAPHYQESQWDILQSLLRVLKIVVAQLRVTFQQHGKIDFIENAQAALLALGNDEHPTDLALALDYQVKHILVDEFQDTSFTQYHLLEKLTAGWEANDGRTLFIVGDPMQSIYKFREAEVGLFIRMRSQGMTQIKLMPLTLAINFRSTKIIIEWNNQHFSKIFPAFSNMSNGAVSYSPSVSHTGELEAQQQSIVRAQGFLNANRHTAAQHIVELIRERKNLYPHEKIAILVRSRPQLADIIPALKKAAIPYRAVDIDPLASRQHIQDLLSLTCAMLHPADRIAWLAILRAPWCGLTLADLHAIANENHYIAISSQLERNDIIKRLSADGQQRLAKIHSILKSKIAERERYNLRYWIESTWLLLGGPACLQDYADMEDAKAFFNLLDEFDQNYQILNLDLLKEKITRLYATAQHDDATLQIMTIHTAKGLEFDTVILPHLESKPAHDDAQLLMWMEQPLKNDKTALLLAPIHATGNDKDSIYEYIKYQQKIKSDYELDRLLYVAATRAKKHLYLFFNVHKNESQECRIVTGSFLEKLWPFFKNQVADLLTENNTAAIDEATQSKNRHTLRLHSSWCNPIQELPAPKIVSHKKQTGFQLSDITPRIIGTVTHRVLQLISEHGIEWWNNESKDQQCKHLKHQLIQLNMPLSRLESAITTSLQAIENMLQDKRGQWILHQHTDAKSEYAISAIINGELENFVIDRTFIDESGTRWIIDYKTSMFTQGDLDDFLANEQKKYLEKMQQYHSAIKMNEDRPIKLGLYFPALPAWKEWEV